MHRILGLNKNNIKSFLNENTETDTTNFELLFMIDTNIIVSSNFISIKIKDFPTILLDRNKFHILVRDTKYDMYIDNTSIDETKWGIDYLRNLFKYVGTITVHPTVETDYNLASEYVLEYSRDKLTELMVEYNTSYDLLPITYKEICSQLIYLSELKLCKELVILKSNKPNMLDQQYMYVTVQLVNNRFIPTLHVLDLYSISPYSTNKKFKYNTYYIPYNKLQEILDRQVIYLPMTNSMFLFNVNSDFIQHREIQQIVG